MMVLGILMVGMWSFFLLAGLVPELKTAPFTILAHIAAEMTAGAMMFVTGLRLFQNKTGAELPAMFGLGMFIYAVIQAPGYYWQQGVYGFVAMFVIFFILGIAAVIYLARNMVNLPLPPKSLP